MDSTLETKTEYTFVSCKFGHFIITKMKVHKKHYSGSLKVFKLVINKSIYTFVSVVSEKLHRRELVLLFNERMYFKCHFSFDSLN